MEAIKRWLRRQLSNPQVALLGVLLLVGLVVIYFFGGMLAPFLAAVVIAYLLDGISLRMEKHLRLPRLFAVTAVFIGFLVGILFLCFVLLPSIVNQVQSFVVEGSPKIIRTVKTSFANLADSAPEWLADSAPEWLAKLGKMAEEETKETGEESVTEEESPKETGMENGNVSPVTNTGANGGALGRLNIDFLERQIINLGQIILAQLLNAFRNVVVWIVYLVLIPVLVFFMLKDKEKIIEWVIQFLPKDRSLATQVWCDVNVQIGNYIRGKFWEIIIVWSVTYATFRLFELKTALLLSLFVGLSVLIPYVGAAIMYIPITLAAFDHAALDSAGNWNQKVFWEVFWILAVYTIIQILDGNVLAPVLLSDVTSLHPVAIIFAILIFGGLWGFWGVFFAIPLATLVHAVIKAWPKEFAPSPPNKPPKE